MKKTLFITLLTLSTSIFAHAIKPALKCGGEALALDHTDISRGGQHAQLVLRDSLILEYFTSVGAIRADEINNKGELILKGFTYEGKFINGGSRVGARGVSLAKENGGYLLEVYTNDYPQFDIIANFYFNDCIELTNK